MSQKSLVKNLMQNSKEILAKPNGITLEQHVSDVMSEALCLLENIPATQNKYKEIVGKELAARLLKICEWHDDGKKKEPWQSACQKDYNIYRDSGSKFCDGKNIRNCGVRHEFYSVKIHKGSNLPMSCISAIVAHHKKLGFKYEERWEELGFKDLWNEIRRESQNVIEQNDLRVSSPKFYEFAGLRGLLQLADHRASAKEDGCFVPKIAQFSYKFPHKEKRGIQLLIEKNYDNDFLLVRAPTGAGKTDASLLWASYQIQNKRADRLVIAMPTRFTSNALAVSVAETLSDTGLYHSSAWFTRFHEDVKQGLLDIEEASKYHEFARLLQTPITVCTIDHLLTALTLTREDHHLISFSLANSCLVIDEADFYDDFTQSNILAMLKILRQWSVPVLLMSASLPESVIKDYQKIGYDVKSILEDKTDENRIRFRVNQLCDYTEVEEIDDILEQMIGRGCGIVYANTIEHALRFYEWFEKRLENKDQVVLYHSRFTEPDKKDIEETLIKMLGKDAWLNKSASGFAILTQIGEMSVNISADIMISEICPIDRLIQRAGRLCRFDKEIVGELYVVCPQNNGKIYLAPYGTYDKKKKDWVTSMALKNTIRNIECKSYSSKQLISVLNEVYKVNSAKSLLATENAKMLNNYFMWNWLINPKQELDTEENETMFWKSRDIDGQTIVFVECPKTKDFQNYLSFEAWKISKAIEIPIYLLKKAKKKHVLDLVKIQIKGDEENIWCIRKGFYFKDKGFLVV